MQFFNFCNTMLMKEIRTTENVAQGRELGEGGGGGGGGGGSIRSYTDFICKIGFKLWALRLFN